MLSRKLHFDEIRQLIFDACPREPGIIVKPSDKFYSTIEKDEVEKIMRERKLSDIPYEIDFFDCDDYALCFAAILCRYCVGQISVRDYNYPSKEGRHWHAMNIFIDYSKTVWYADALNNKIMLPEDALNYYIYFLEV